jgi:hypothetical protein
MSIQIYKPNSKNAGAAFTFALSKGSNGTAPSLYISAISQFSWDEGKKIGTFGGNAKNPEKTVNVKINELECGEIISAFRDRRDFTTFHSYEGSSTTIKLSPWDKPSKISKYDPSSKSFKDEKIIIPAFGITISKGKGNSFKIAIEPGEIEVLSSLLSIFINESLKFKINKHNSYSSKSSPKSTPPAVEDTSEDEDDMEDVPF